MMKFFTLALFFALSFSNFAQNNLVNDPSFMLTSYRDFELEVNNFERANLKKNGVKSREKILYIKGSAIKSTHYFDTEGRIIREEREEKKGLFTVAYKYDSNGNLTERVSSRPNGQEIKTNYTYNAENKMLTWVRLDNGQEYSRGAFAYNTDGKLLSDKRFTKSSGEVPASELVYTYYENGDRKTTHYYEKGKLKHSWNYDCKPEGELIGVKIKDETTICKIEELDSVGNRVNWEREFDEKGELTKVKTVISPDTLVLSRQYYKGVDKLVGETVYTYNELRKCTAILAYSFDKTGKAYLSSETFIDPFGTMDTKAYTSKGETAYTKIRLKNERGQTIKTEHVSKRRSDIYLCSFLAEKTLIQSEVHIQQKRTFVTEYSYTFH